MVAKFFLSKYFKKIEKAEDLERIVKDKRVGKRANKQKRAQRNRHYTKVLLRKLKSEIGR